MAIDSVTNFFQQLANIPTEILRISTIVNLMRLVDCMDDNTCLV